jgi:polyisoprenyl-teichoic acid--peptidoglycan teichoic acid transferase
MTTPPDAPRTGATTAVLPVVGGDPASTPKPKKKRDRIKVAFFSVLAVFAVVVVVVGLFGWNLWSSFDKAKKIQDAFPTGERPAAVAGAQTILLLGSDTRGSSDEDEVSGRSDTIMVVNVPADHQSVSVMSIMRDNWVEIPGHGEAKINAAMALGGVPLVVETVEKFIDARIDHVAIVDFESFAGMADALGGVTVDNPKEFTAVSGEHFDEGKITLRGDDALAFVRERKAFATGDYQRAANQQRFMKGLLSEVLSADTLLNPFRMSSLVSEVSPFLSVDAGVDPGYLLSTLWNARDIRSSDVHFFTSPTLGTGWRSGQSVVLPDWDQIDVVRKALRDGTLSEYEPPKL